MTLARRTNQPHLDRARRVKLDEDLDAALLRWVTELSPHTRRSYECGLRQFAQYLYGQGLITVSSIDAAGHFLVALEGPRDANILVQAWLESMAAIDPDTGSPYYTIATIHQRATALRWAVKQSRRQGLIQWSLDVAVPKASKDPKSGRLIRKRGRDMEGPSLDDVKRMLEEARSQGDPRLEVLLLLIFNETLRRGEICALNVEDVDVRRRVMHVSRKKRDELEKVYLSEQTTAAIKRLLESRGDSKGALILGGSCYGNSRDRISPSGLTLLLDRISHPCDVYTSPHRLRHTSLTLGDQVRTQLGLDEKSAMNRAGQKSSVAYHRYLDHREEPVRAITDGVASLLTSVSDRPAAEEAEGPRMPPKRKRKRKRGSTKATRAEADRLKSV